MMLYSSTLNFVMLGSSKHHRRSSTHFVCDALRVQNFVCDASPLRRPNSRKRSGCDALRFVYSLVTLGSSFGGSFGGL